MVRQCCRRARRRQGRSEEHTSELQSLRHLVCRLLLEKKTGIVSAHTRRVSLPARVLHSARTGPAPPAGAESGEFAQTLAWPARLLARPRPFFLRTGDPPKFPLFPYPAPFR